MEQGSLEELVLTRSVTKHIRKQNKSFVQGTGVGHDFARTGTLVVTEAVGRVPELVWVKALNNFYVSGGTPVMARVVLLLPQNVREGRLKEYMSRFNRLAEDEGVQLAGGHSEVSLSYGDASFVVTVTGNAGDYSHNKRLIKPKSDIIMVGYTAMLGTSLLVKQKRAELLKRFSASYIGERLPWGDNYSVKEAVRLLMGCEDVCYMHDVSHGGVYAALWQLGAYLSRGISVGHYSLPILQSTIEFCELFGLNPYMLEGTGALIAVTKEGSGPDVARLLCENGINASLIGHVEANNERMVYLGDAHSLAAQEKANLSEAAFFKDAENKYIDRRCLAPVKGDEIYKISEGP